MKNQNLKKFGITLGLSAALFAGDAFGGIRAITPNMYDGKTNGWQVTTHYFRQRNLKQNPPKVVFVGDSITHYWDGPGEAVWKKYFKDGELKGLNLGIAGDCTQHVLWRIGDGKGLDGYEAKCVVLMIGTNNSGLFTREDEPVGDTILGIRAIVNQIRAKQPQAKLVLCAIFPRGGDASDPKRVRNDLINREIMKFADGKEIFWCDFREQFITPDGTLIKELFTDGLHPATKGYEIWADAVLPYIRAAVKDEPMPANRYAPFCRDNECPKGQNPATYANTRIRSEGYGSSDWWLDRYQRNRSQILDSKGEIDLVFAGDSITHFWEEAGAASLQDLRKTYSVLDIGYSGDRTEHLLWRCENGELDGYKTKCIMLMIGTNNTWHRKDPPEQIAEGIRKILDVMRAKQPKAKILLLPIFPFGEGPKNANRVNNEKVNAIIRDYADGDRIFWLDFNSAFLDAKGDMKKSSDDRCHPNAAAYQNIWLPAVLPCFKKFCH